MNIPRDTSWEKDVQKVLKVLEVTKKNPCWEENKTHPRILILKRVLKDIVRDGRCLDLKKADELKGASDINCEKEKKIIIDRIKSIRKEKDERIIIEEIFSELMLQSKERIYMHLRKINKCDKELGKVFTEIFHAEYKEVKSK